MYHSVLSAKLFLGFLNNTTVPKVKSDFAVVTLCLSTGAYFIIDESEPLRFLCKLEHHSQR